MKKLGIGFALGAMVCGLAHADDLTWIGATNSTWNLSNALWQNSAGATVKFALGDNVTFGENTDPVTVGIDKTVTTVGDLLVDSSGDYSLNGGHIAEMKSLVKRGTGTLSMTTSSLHSFTNDVIIEEGLWKLTGGWGGYRQGYADRELDHTQWPVGNVHVSRTIHIGENATLYSDSPWAFGGPQTTPKIKMIVDGIISNKYSASQWTTAPLAFGELHLNSTNFYMFGADLTPNSETNQKKIPTRIWPSFEWNGDVYFGMSDPYKYKAIGRQPYMCIGVGDIMPALHVPDISGDDASDVTLMGSIQDSVQICPQYDADYIFQYFKYPSKPSRFRKVGAGTLEMGENSNSTMSGDIIVEEGTLKVTWNGGYGKGPLGNPLVERTIAVLDGTVLEINDRMVNGNVYADCKTTYAVTNGTIRLGNAGNLNYICSLNFGNIDFYDAKFEYSGTGNNVDGYCTLGAKARFDGTKPFVFEGAQGYNMIQLGYGTDKEEVVIDDPSDVGNTEKQTAYYTGYTEFDVCDITGGEKGDGISDVIIKSQLRNVPSVNRRADDATQDTNKTPMYRYFSCGLKKTGPGTLELTKTCIYTGTTHVVNGSLLVNGSIEKSPATTVYSGGLIGGSGTVTNLTVLSGGGFVTDYADPSKKLTVKGTYTLPEAGIVRVTGYDGALESFKTDTLFSLVGADNKDDVDPTQWSVVLDGYTAHECRNITVTRTGDMLCARYRKLGFVIMIK